MKNRFLYSKSNYDNVMSERFVEILVKREVRDLVKQKKGDLSYNQFLKKVVDNELMINGGMWK